MEEKDKRFMVEACRCRRCGRLLTSAEAVKLGYGRMCAVKAGILKIEKRTGSVEGQLSIYDILEGRGGRR